MKISTFGEPTTRVPSLLDCRSETPRRENQLGVLMQAFFSTNKLRDHGIKTIKRSHQH